MMCAVWLKLIAVLCLSCAALSGSESDGVLRMDAGGSMTIQCRPPHGSQILLSVKKGVTEDEEVFVIGVSSSPQIGNKFKGRLQSHGNFPKVDILIKNVTNRDTGPYFCIYTGHDTNTESITTQRGSGSVLLVVSDSTKQCDPANHSDLVLVSVVISAVVLLGIIIGFLIWIIHKTRRRHRTVKPRRVTNNDVYEDMRGTIRR